MCDKNFASYSSPTKIMDRSYKIFDFLQSTCLNHARSPKIMYRSYKIIDLLHSDYIILAIW